MSNKKRLLVFHRNRLFRDCLAEYLSTNCGYDAQSVDHTQADPIAELLRVPVDLLLLDLNLPHNMTVEISRAINNAQLVTKIIILVPDEHEQIVDCIASGIHGCVLERSHVADLNAAITKVRKGEMFCSPDIVAAMFSELARFARTPTGELPKSKTRRLTGREQEVLDLLGKRKSNKQIASELNVSLFTVKNHVHNILEKLNVGSRVEAVERARQHTRQGK